MHCSDLADAAADSGPTILARLGAAIRGRRTALGVSQRELAARAGVDRAFLNGVENGRRNPTLAMLAKLADGLGTTVGALTSNL